MLKKKIWASFQRIIELFTQKFVTTLSKIWIWDPGSGKNLSRSWGQEGTGSRIRIRNTACIKYNSQSSGKHALENIVSKLDANYEGNLINLALVNRQQNRS
jgi:hypothetical protein